MVLAMCIESAMHEGSLKGGRPCCLHCGVVGRPVEAFGRRKYGNQKPKGG